MRTAIHNHKSLFRWFSAILAAALFAAFSFTSPVPQAHAATLPFSVQPQGEAWQSTGYFKFNGVRGKSRKLAVKIQNMSAKPIKVSVSRLNALTAIYGGVEYIGKAKASNTRLLRQSRAMRPALSGPGRIALAPHQAKIVTFTFKAPKSVKTGTLLGALGFKVPLDTEHASGQVKGHVVIYNQLQRVIGVEADYTKEPVHVAVGKVAASPTPSSPYVLIRLANSSPMIVDHVKLDYAVSQKGRQLFKGHSSDFNMAPTSAVGYSVVWNYKTFAPGRYSLHLEMTVNGKKTVVDRPFTVSRPQAAKYQKFSQVRSVAPTNTGWPLWAVILVSVLATAGVCWLVFFLVNRHRNKKGEAEQEKQKKD